MLVLYSSSGSSNSSSNSGSSRVIVDVVVLVVVVYSIVYIFVSVVQYIIQIMQYTQMQTHAVHTHQSFVLQLLQSLCLLFGQQTGLLSL